MELLWKFFEFEGAGVLISPQAAERAQDHEVIDRLEQSGGLRLETCVLVWKADDMDLELVVTTDHTSRCCFHSPGELKSFFTANTSALQQEPTSAKELRAALRLLQSHPHSHAQTSSC